MIVEDFTISEMVAKCTFITVNTFTQEMSYDDKCRKAQEDAFTNNTMTEFQLLTNLANGGGDFNNWDNDYTWNTNNAPVGEHANQMDPDAMNPVNCFTSVQQCMFDVEKENITFMSYPQIGTYPIAACQADSGSSLLQNS